MLEGPNFILELEDLSREGKGEMKYANSKLTSYYSI